MTKRAFYSPHTVRNAADGHQPFGVWLPGLSQHADNLLAPETFPPRGCDEGVHLSSEMALLGGTRDGHSAASSKLEKSLVTKDPKRPEHGVDVHAQDGREVLRRWKALPWARLAVRE